MLETGMSGLMSGEGKLPAASRFRSSALPRLYGAPFGGGVRHQWKEYVMGFSDSRPVFLLITGLAPGHYRIRLSIAAFLPAPVLIHRTSESGVNLTDDSVCTQSTHRRGDDGCSVDAGAVQGPGIERHSWSALKMLITWKCNLYGVAATIQSRFRQSLAAPEVVAFPQFANRGRRLGYWHVYAKRGRRLADG